MFTEWMVFTLLAWMGEEKFEWPQEGDIIWQLVGRGFSLPGALLLCEVAN